MTKILMGIIGAMGLAAMLYYNLSVVPMKMILGKDFGEFRLVLLQKSKDV